MATEISRSCRTVGEHARMNTSSCVEGNVKLTLRVQLLDRVVRLFLGLVQDECISGGLAVEPRRQVDFDAVRRVRCALI
jgi:hypothetical protein